MGGGIGDGNLFRTYNGGNYSTGGGHFGLRHYKDSANPIESAESVFKEHAERIRTSKEERLQLNSLKEDIHRALSNEFVIKKVNVIGSITKDTQIKKQNGNDIDIMIVLDENAHGQWLVQENGPRNSLEKAKKVLQNEPKFRNVEMHVDRNVVTLETGNSKADVLLAFPSSDGGQRIADTYGKQKWIKTNPRLTTRLFTDLDKQRNNKVSELTREVKHWNQRNGGYLSSHHIEWMVYDYFKKNKSKDGDNSSRVNTREFFERIPWYMKRHMRDPLYEEKVDSYLSDNKRKKIISNSQKSTKILRKAEKEVRKGNTENSNRLYREFLGE